MARGTTKDGREFPALDGELLAWDSGLYMTWNEERAGYPRARAVLAETDTERLWALERGLVRDSLGRMFGHNASKHLALVREELAQRNAGPDPFLLF